MIVSKPARDWGICFMLKSYLRYRQFLFLWTGIVLAIYAFLQYLYWYPLESIGYTALIVLTLLVLISALDYRRYRRRLRQLDSLTEAWISLEREMPDTRDPLEQCYQQLILKRAETAGRTGHDVDASD